MNVVSQTAAEWPGRLSEPRFALIFMPPAKQEMSEQSANSVVMIRPRRFFPNPETALDNAFQQEVAVESPAALTLRARVVPHVPPGTLVGQITHGRLVGPPVPARPG